MTTENFGTLEENLARIRALSALPEVVPYAATVKKDTELLNFGNAKAGNLRAICKEPRFAIVLAEFEAGFIHENHYHDEVEVLCLLSGAAVVRRQGSVIGMEVNRPFVLAAKEPHQIHYLEASVVLAITIPASPAFPQPIQTGGAAQ